MVVVALGAALLLTKRRADQAADASINRALEATQSAIEDALTSRSHTLLQVTRALAQVPFYVSRVEKGLLTDTRADLLDQVDEFRQQAEADWALITDGQGVLKAWTLNRDAFDEPLGGGALVGLALGGDVTEGLWIEEGPQGDALFQAVGVPLSTSPGRVLGVLVLAAAVDSALAARLERQTASEIVFVALDEEGRRRVAVSTLPRGELDSVLASLPPLGVDDSVTPRLRVAAGDETWVGAVGGLRTADGFVVGEYAGLRSRDVELAAYTQLRESLALAFGGGIVFALLSSLLLARQITRPVRELVAATRQVSEGRYSGVIEVGTRDEIGQLADAFRDMVGELREKQELVEFLSSSGGQTLAMATTAPQAPVGGIAVGGVLAGRYEIKEVLGRGGMGVVYRAHDRDLNEPVAIKTLHGSLLEADSTSLERFKQEIRLARRISHPNVVRTHDLGEVDGTYFITMELVEGTSLEQVLRKRGRLPIGVVLTVDKQLCRALEVAHEQGVIHRDIKPQNMVVDAKGFLKVMDFGIARLAETRGEGLTAAGSVIGTPEYMAPEQLMGEELDGRTDLYAAGAVLFECATGRQVFAATSLASVMMKQVDEAPADPRTLNPDVPESLAHVILRALAKRREDRWQSAEELSQALERVEA